MKSNNLIQEKSFDFAIRIVNVMKYLNEYKREYVMAKQLLRCGTSIGANIEESIGGYSKADFLYKMGIAYKETRETIFWIKLLKATNYRVITIQKHFEKIQPIVTLKLMLNMKKQNMRK